MNSDPEAKIRDLLTWLLQDPEQALLAAQNDVKTASPPLTGQSSNPVSSEQPIPASSQLSAEADRQWGELDPLDSEEIDCLTPSSRGEMESGQSQAMPPLEGQPLEMGEIPTVQDRFQALLQQRLRAEIQSNLPRFPWETEVCEYYDEVYETSAELSVVSELWMTQLRNLSLPIKVPESVLAQLLNHCQDVVQSNLREGAKLVQAVESLFPDQFQMLNQLAGMVLVSPVRGTSTLPETANFPPSYEAASASQQMVLSLLAARQIINDLTLNVSLSGEKVERQWLTHAGVLILQASYHSDSRSSELRLQAVMPCGGCLTLQGNDDIQATAQRPNLGVLSVTLFDVSVQQTYALAVQLQLAEQLPLQFAVCLTD